MSYVISKLHNVLIVSLRKKPQKTIMVNDKDIVKHDPIILNKNTGSVVFTACRLLQPLFEVIGYIAGTAQLLSRATQGSTLCQF